MQKTTDNLDLFYSLMNISDINSKFFISYLCTLIILGSGLLLLNSIESWCHGLAYPLKICGDVIAPQSCYV